MSCPYSSLPSAMADTLLDIFVPILKDVKNTRYSELASSSVIAYDYLLTLDQEIQHIWKAKWTIGKVLFFMNRYYTLFVVVFNNFALFSPSLTDDWPGDSCLVWFRWQGWTGLIACAIAETILQLRLYALYYGNKKILALMVGFFISAMVSSGTIMGSVLGNVDARANLIPLTKFCLVTNDLHHFYAFWIPILCFETLLCFLACVRGYKSYKDREIRLRRRRQSASLQEQEEAGSDLNILEILLRDSVGYFVIMFATYFTTTMMWIFGPTTVIEIPVGFTVALSSVIGNRLLLNLRDSKQAHSLSANPNNRHATSSLASMTSSSHSHLASAGATTTIENEHGMEIGAYELHALRSLKASM